MEDMMYVVFYRRDFDYGTTVRLVGLFRTPEEVKECILKVVDVEWFIGTPFVQIGDVRYVVKEVEVGKIIDMHVIHYEE